MTLMSCTKIVLLLRRKCPISKTTIRMNSVAIQHYNHASFNVLSGGVLLFISFDRGTRYLNTY